MSVGSYQEKNMIFLADIFSCFKQKTLYLTFNCCFSEKQVFLLLHVSMI